MIPDFYQFIEALVLIPFYDQDIHTIQRDIPFSRGINSVLTLQSKGKWEVDYIHSNNFCAPLFLSLTDFAYFFPPIIPTPRRFIKRKFFPFLNQLFRLPFDNFFFSLSFGPLITFFLYFYLIEKHWPIDLLSNKYNIRS